MKSIEQKLSEAFQSLEDCGKVATVIEIRESRQPLENKLVAAERALGGNIESSRRRLAESARRAFKLTPEEARAFAEPNGVDTFLLSLKDMD